ncbi:hypothetical protein tinsulaeT_17120 [Thalassotalea insulae]|uniref:DUF3325 domain-containing protein n=1 Tax=Thalassotalea insulae TaxID=2056778 RepID=A0ABQ6GR01_9GAMM|nr:hypothetical protein [Thalassotalea insulae]GLX78372.1 hypothetical protein tinsulaeT_17120 [Thalassotalea insulae]
MLIFASILLIAIGIIHSYLGEKYLLIRLFRRDNLPRLLGSDWFTKRTLRFAWHLTTLAWWGFAGILIVYAAPTVNFKQGILVITASVFLLSGLLSAGFTKGKHFSWCFFWLIAAICFYQAYLF